MATRTWTHYQNQTPDDHSSLTEMMRDIVWKFKDKLVTAGWTVTQSSDGASQAASDLWVDSDDLLWAASGAHSWIVLKSPNNFPTTGKNVYLGLDCFNATAEDLTIHRGTADWTGGSASTIGTGTNVEVWTDQQLVVNTDPPANHSWHLHLSSVGDIIWYISKDGDALAAGGFMMLGLAESQSGDLWPLYEMANYLATGDGAFEADELASTLHIRGPWIDGTIGADNIMLRYMSHVAADVGTLHDQNGMDHSGEMFALPIYVHSLTTNKIEHRGRCVDVTWAPTHANVVQGTTSPAGGPVEYAIVGAVWVPTDTTPSF